MAMTNRKRMEMALSFQEADRVPIEISLTPTVWAHPKAEKLASLVNTHASTFRGCEGIAAGFMGVPAEFTKELFEKNDEYTSYKYNYKTANGDFTAIRQEDNLNPSYWHWKTYYIETIEDMERFADCDFPPMPVADNYLEKLEQTCGERFVPQIFLYHPFGQLARSSNLSEFYTWVYTEKDLIHRVFKKQYAQINDLITRLKAPYVYGFNSFEMAIPPWMGRNLFDEMIFPYDKEMNGNIHRFGGKVHHHSHDKIFDYLEHWADMGVDSIEPLEMPPAGNTDLKAAKELVGDRMAFAGNIPSERFTDMETEEVEHMVRQAISDAAEGGGYILRCTSLVAGLESFRNEQQMLKMISNAEAFIEAGLKYGQYKKMTVKKTVPLSVS